jgi:PAS domain S-box-containing protein
MPWMEPPTDSDQLRWCIRDLVALSTLPAKWQNYDTGQIGDSIVSTLISMLDTDFVFIALPGLGNQLVIELSRTGPNFDPEHLERVRAVLQRQKDTLSIERDFVVAGLSGSDDLHIVAAPIGFGGDAILAAGSTRSTFPTWIERLLLNSGVNQASAAFQHWLGDAEKKRFTTLVMRTNDFVGITSLNGQVQYVNPAGLQLVGLASIDEALRLHILDFVAPRERSAVWEERWPLVLRDGRWKGELDLKHFRSGALISFLIDCFRIDDPRTGEPMNVATISRDLTEQKQSEAALRQLNEELERRVQDRTIELAVANKRLLAEKLERERADLRLQRLQNEFFHAARLTSAGQMAAALAHELNQPLTAITNSVNAAKRLLARGRRADLTTAQEIADEAAEQTLRASEIIRRLRQFVAGGDTERRVEVLPSMIEEAVGLVSSSLAPLAFQPNYEFDDRAQDVVVNRIQIQQVLVNLIRNAFEAMAEREPRQVTLTTRALDNGMIEVAVADLGSGIPHDIAGRLFEPFVSSKHDGMGVGLSISRSIIEAHDGRLTAEPGPEGGTVFRFTLPGGVAYAD